MMAVLASCQTKKGELGEFNLMPAAQQYTVYGASDLMPEEVLAYESLDGSSWPAVGERLSKLKEDGNAQVTFLIDDNLDIKAEGYRMEITDVIDIKAKDEAGLFYALATLEQLLVDAFDQGVALPACVIEDYPAMTYRGVHIDVKHHMEKAEYLYSIIDQLAAMKVNQVLIEFEDKLGYETRPTVGARDALSVEQWKQWSEYAHERHIEVSPLVQGLGHVNFILKHDEFKHLRDDPESDWAINPLMDETYELQFDLYDDAIKATPYGQYIHIGGDEVETTGGTLGEGQSPLELQLIWMAKVCKYVEDQGRTPMVWDDQFFKLTGVYESMFDSEMDQATVDSIWTVNAPNLDKFIELFPKNCLYLRWNYDNPECLGNQKAIDWFKEKGLQCLGTTAAQTRWLLMPQEQGKIPTIEAFAEVAIDKGLEGLLCTLWDDDSPHFETYWRGLYCFSEYAWSGVKRELPELFSAYRHRRFSYQLSDPSHAFINDLEEPAYFWNNAFIKWISGVRRWGERNHIHTHGVPESQVILDLPQGGTGEWTKEWGDRVVEADSVMQVCQGIESKIKQSKLLATRNQHTLDIYDHINQLVMFNCKTLQIMKKYDLGKEGAYDELKALPAEFKSIRGALEKTYSKTRILDKPDNFILDQNHHRHTADQDITFDWQFKPEMYLMDKIEQLK